MLLISITDSNRFGIVDFRKKKLANMKPKSKQKTNSWVQLLIDQFLQRKLNGCSSTCWFYPKHCCQFCCFFEKVWPSVFLFSPLISRGKIEKKVVGTIVKTEWEGRVPMRNWSEGTSLHRHFFVSFQNLTNLPPGWCQERQSAAEQRKAAASSS